MRSLTFSLLLACSNLAYAQVLERPWAVVIRADDVKFESHLSGTKIDAKPGTFLFDGDQITILSGGSVSFVWCSVAGRGFAYTAKSGALQLSSKPLSIPAPQVVYCKLPKVEREPLSTTAPPDAAIQDQLRGTPAVQQVTALGEQERAALELARDAVGTVADPLMAPVAALTYAVELQEHGLARNAAIEYSKVARIWNSNAALRKLAHELSLPAMASKDWEHEPATGADGSSIKASAGKTYAVVIGISEYEQKKRLRFAERDATRFAEYLSTKRGGEVKVQPILSKDARTSIIRRRIQAVVKLVKPEDTFVLFVSSHGAMNSKGVPVIMPASTSAQDPNLNGIPLDEFAGWVYGAKSLREWRLFLDFCYSGSPTYLVPQRNAGESRSNLNYVVFSAARSYDPKHFNAYENKIFGGGHGAFTYFVLRGLNSREAAEPGNIVSPNGLYGYLEKQLLRATGNRQMPDRILSTSLPAIADLTKDGLPFDVTAVDVRIDPSEWKAQTVGTRNAGPKVNIQNVRWDSPESLEDYAESVLLQYLDGDEVPQSELDFLGAARTLDRALAIESDSIYLRARRDFCEGRALLFMRQYELGMKLIENSIRLDPSAAYAYNGLGIAFLEQARYSEAKAAFEDAIARAPNWAYPRHNLALTYAQEGRYPEAIRTYIAAKQIAPDYAYLPYSLGLIYKQVNRMAEAEQEFQLAVTKARWRPEPVIALAQLRAHQRRFVEAEQLFKQAIKLSQPDTPVMRAAVHNYGIYLANAGARFSEAEKLWLGNSSYLPSLFALADAYEKQQRFSGAAQTYEAILKLTPDHLSARLALAANLAAGGKYPDALGHLKLATDQYPRSALVWRTLAQMQERIGDSTAALAAYRRAASLTTDPEQLRFVRRAARRIGGEL
jgi:tetratricopeptide (TPR) repeat protein